MSKIIPIFPGVRIMAKSQPFSIKWRRAANSSRGPASSTTRHILSILSDYMDDDGNNCLPGQDKIALDAGLTDRTVRTHLAAAERDGWFTRRLENNGTKWAHHVYIPCIPPETDSGAKGEPPENDCRTTGNSRQNHRKMTAEPPETDSAYRLNTALETASSTARERAAAEDEIGEPPYEYIMEAYNNRLGSRLTSVLRITETRKKLIRARWNEDSRQRRKSFWPEFFQYVAEQCPVLVDDSVGSAWTANFDWLLDEKHFMPIIEGTYEGQAQTHRHTDIFADAI